MSDLHHAAGYNLHAPLRTDPSPAATNKRAPSAIEALTDAEVDAILAGKMEAPSDSRTRTAYQHGSAQNRRCAACGGSGHDRRNCERG